MQDASDYQFTSADFAQDLREEGLRDELRKAHLALGKAKVKQDAIAEAAFEGARAAFRALPNSKLVVPQRDRRRKKTPEAALWAMTDWQGAKVTPSYNSEVMQQRVAMFVQKALHITEIQRSDHPVDDCTIAFGGDMIEGLFNFPTQPYEIDATLFDQFVNVAKLITDVIRVAAQNYNKVHVVPEWGNHGRIGSKRDAVVKSDNADRMTYRLAAEMCRDMPNVTWQECPEDIQRLEIGNYRALVIHGDEVGRGGFSSPAGLVNHVNRWKAGSYPWDFRDVYMGHYHVHGEWSLANGEGVLFQTGSTESDNRYARDNLASTAVPSQRLHFVDPEKGRVTAQYRVFLN